MSNGALSAHVVDGGAFAVNYTEARAPHLRRGRDDRRRRRWCLVVGVVVVFVVVLVVVVIMLAPHTCTGVVPIGVAERRLGFDVAWFANYCA